MIPPDLLPWALFVAALLGCAVGLVVGFYLTTKAPPRLHAWAAGETRPDCTVGNYDRVLMPSTRSAAFLDLDRARLCGANVCRACLDRLRDR